MGLLDWLFCKHRRAVHLLAFGVKLRDSEGSYLYRCQDCGKVFWSDKRHNNITELPNDLNKAGG